MKFERTPGDEFYHHYNIAKYIGVEIHHNLNSDNIVIDLMLQYAICLVTITSHLHVVVHKTLNDYYTKRKI